MRDLVLLLSCDRDFSPKMVIFIGRFGVISNGVNDLTLSFMIVQNPIPPMVWSDNEI